MLMIHPIHVITNEAARVKSDDINSLTSSCNALFRSFYKDGLKLHMEYINLQKKLFSNFKKYEDANDTAYNILTGKFEKFTNRTFEILKANIDKTVAKIFASTRNPNFQVGIIKSYVNRHQDYLNKKFPIQYGNIGVIESDFPDPSEFKFTLKKFEDAFDPLHPVRLDMTGSGSIIPEFEWDMKIIFEHAKPYTVEELLDKYKWFKGYSKDLLNRHKKQYAEIQEFCKNINEKYSRAFSNSMKVATDAEDFGKCEIYKHNHQAVTKFIDAMFKGCIHHYQNSMYMVINSLKAYYFTIQTIYDDLVPEFEKKRRGLIEAKLTAADRREIPDSDYGIPSLKKYPMPDKVHVLSAIRLSGHCPPGYEAELARNVLKKMRQYDIPLDTVRPENKLYKYIHKNEGEIHHEQNN